MNYRLCMQCFISSEGKKGSYTPLACEIKFKLSPFGKTKVSEINSTWVGNNERKNIN